MDTPQSIDEQENDKYHRLILQNSAYKRLISTIENAKPEERELFFQNLYNPLKDILSCFKCKAVLEKNAVAFSCGHKYCEKCSPNLCTECKVKESQKIRDFSNILALLDEIKSNFSINIIVPEMVKFLLHPKPIPQEVDQLPVSKETSKPSVPVTSSKDTKMKNTSKVSTANKKTKIENNPRSVKKLEIIKENVDSECTRKILETDSESLFVETSKKSRNRKPVQSYLAVQSTANEVLDSPKPNERRPKRKRTANDGETPIIEKPATRNTKKARVDSKAASICDGENAESDLLALKSRKNSPSDLKNQGTFSGFIETEAVNGYDKLKSMNKLLRRWSEGNANNTILCATGEVKLEKKDKSDRTLEAVRDAIIGSCADIKTDSTFPAVSNADNEELDLGVWKKEEEQRERRNSKSLFKSVRDRNKKDRSITSAVVNLSSSKNLTTETKNEPIIEMKAQKCVEATTDVPISEKPVSIAPLQNESTDKVEREVKLVPQRSQRPTRKCKSLFEEVKSLPTKKAKENEEIKQLPAIEKKLDSAVEGTTPGKLIPGNEIEVSSECKQDKQVADFLCPPKQEHFEVKTNTDGTPLRTYSTKNKKLDLGNLEQESSIILKRNNTRMQNFTSFKKINDILQNEISNGDAANSSPIIFNPSNIFSSTPYQSTKNFKNVRSAGLSPKIINTNVSPIQPTAVTNGTVCKDFGASEKQSTEIVPIAEEVKTHAKLSHSPSNSSVHSSRINDSPPAHVSHCEIPCSSVVTSPPKFVTVIAEIHDEPTRSFPSDTVATSEAMKIEKVNSNEVENEVPDNTLEQITVIANVPEKVPATPTQENKTSQQLEKERMKHEETQKIKQLQESIKNRNEKTLASLKKSFRVPAPHTLSIEKVKGHKRTMDKVELNVSKEDFTSMEMEKPSSLQKTPTAKNFSKQAMSSNNEQCISAVTAITPDLGDMTTLPPSPPWKEVACQTTPDLHIALLKETFPHLFQKCGSKQDFPLSVYDTPDDLTNTKTPAPAATVDAKYTALSSVTTSEKKLLDEKDFAERSVLLQCTSVLCSANKSKSNLNVTAVSGYAPLSSEKKDTSEIFSERRRVSCRLNFQDSYVPDSSEIFETERTQCAEKPAPWAAATTPSTVSVKAKALPASVAAFSTPHEISFNDSVIEEEMLKCTAAGKEDLVADENCASASILQQNDAVYSMEIVGAKDTAETTPEIEVKTFFENSPDGGDGVSGGDDEFKAKSNHDFDSDVDDVDYVAGTPTCYLKRCADSSLEKLRPQMAVVRDTNDHIGSPLEEVVMSTPSIRPLKEISQNTMLPRVEKPHNSSQEIIATRMTQRKEIKKSSLELFSSIMSGSPSSVQLHLTTSGLKETDTKIIKDFCAKFCTFYADKLTSKTTHLIVKPDETNQANRTFKYLQAIVNCIRVVSLQWIYDCLEQNKILSEENYIPLDSSGECGPLRAYNVNKGLTPSPLSWLKDYCIYITEPAPPGCTMSQLKEMITKAGAVVVDSEKYFKLYPGLHRVVIINEDEDCDDEFGRNVAEWLQNYHAVTLEFTWILEVIGRNRILPFAEYEVIDIPSEYLLRFNFPADMLKMESNTDNFK